ncbi:MAG: hypothetical protein EU530_02555 [Promethearchaeota archaeon]|nr:MAG: hypothetical protein EU530_02555 [Candidatus Lokiarchaeota archaeon]
MEKSTTSNHKGKYCHYCYSTEFIRTKQGFFVCVKCATESIEINIGISDQKIRDQTLPGFWNYPNAERNKIAFLELIAYATQSEDLKYYNRKHKEACEEIHRICSALEIPYGIHMELITAFEYFYPIICETFKEKTYPRHITKFVPVLIYQVLKIRLKGRVTIKEICEKIDCAADFNSVLWKTYHIFSSMGKFS